MQTMTSNKYIPTWERSYNKWDTEPEVWDSIEVEEETTEEDLATSRLLASLDAMQIEEIELDEEMEEE